MCALLRMFLVIMCCSSYTIRSSLVHEREHYLFVCVLYMCVFFNRQRYAIHFQLLNLLVFIRNVRNVCVCVSKNNNREKVMWCLWIQNFFMISCLIFCIFCIYKSKYEQRPPIICVWIGMIFNIIYKKNRRKFFRSMGTIWKCDERKFYSFV